MIVCIAEKPSVARDIANVIGARNACNGYLEGNGYQVTWTFGHLCELKEPAEYSPYWKAWSLSALPMIPPRFGIRLKKDSGIERQFGIIRELMQRADMIINCGDAGQEGELIQRWVMQLAEARCPVQRLWISSLTEEAIREGFKQLKDQSEYRSLYEAGLCRAIGDWLLGMNATRLYTLRYGRQRQTLSIGRVQTPTLALIVERQREIENFRPETYWVLTTIYRDTTFTAVLEEGERGFRTKEDGERALAEIETTTFHITDIQKKKGSEAPPRLFDLTSLQVESNNKFGYSAEQTLQLVQSLYEKKYTTYPRVDTTYLSDDIYPKCGNILRGIETRYPTEIGALHGRKLLKSKKVFDSSKVTDHHAIIPTGIAPQNMTEAEADIYDLIALRFIASFYPDCTYQQTTVTGTPRRDDGTEGQTFRANTKIITSEGWRTVIKKRSQSALSHSEAGETPADERGLVSGSATGEAQADERVVVFRKGESGPHTPSLTEKTTTPPKPYTEATLLRAMETAGRLVEDEGLRDALKENGIGRPSTRAAIIETLFKRHYIEKKGGKGKSLYATATGCTLIDTIKNDLLKSAELTGQWEKKLRQIEHHEYEATTFVQELKDMVTDIVAQTLKG